MKHTLRVLYLLSLILASCQYSLIYSTPQSDETYVPFGVDWDDHSFFQKGLVISQQRVLDQLPGASIYHLDLQIADDLIHVTGVQEVRYTNQEDVALEILRFRLFPNILGGSLSVSDVSINGGSVSPSYSLADSLMSVQLIRALQPGENVVVRITFTVTVPTELDSNYGVFASTEGVLALAHFYPMIPVYDSEGWNAEIPPDQGDVTYADSSFFLVRVTAPEKIVLVASGTEISHNIKDKMQVVVFAAGPVRDFYIVASADYDVKSKTYAGTTINSYAPKDLRAGAELALDVAAKAIANFSKRYTPYPYTELDIVSTPTKALGIEYPGIIAIAMRIYDLSEKNNGVPASVIMESTVVHEVGHQWFYNIVGNDQLDEPWLDESLTQYVTWQYYKDIYGSDGASGFKQALDSRWERVDRRAIPIGMPVSFYKDKEYGAIVYGRGALFFDELAQHMGQDTFDKFIQDYVQTYKWGIINSNGLKQFGEQYCSCDLTQLYQEWVYTTP